MGSDILTTFSRAALQHLFKRVARGAERLAVCLGDLGEGQPALFRFAADPRPPPRSKLTRTGRGSELIIGQLKENSRVNAIYRVATLTRSSSAADMNKRREPSIRIPCPTTNGSGGYRYAAGKVHNRKAFHRIR